MSCVRLLRRLGLWPRRRASPVEVVIATAENAVRDNSEAFREVSQVQTEGVEVSARRLRPAIQRARNR